LPLDTVKLPPGFTIELVTDRVPDAREMALGAFADGRGTLFVGSNQSGSVYAVTLDQSRATDVRTIASGLQLPVGVAYRNGSLYVSAVSRIVRIDGVDDLKQRHEPVVVTDRFPTETHHGWKFIAFGPDGDLYVPVGAPCNICERDDERYYNIQKIKVDGSGQAVVAKGVRNSVGFDWNPVDGSLWFTDNGRDLLGEDVPSDELNHVAARSAAPPHIADPDFGKGHPCSAFTPPAALLGAHVASLGMRFYHPATSAAEPYPTTYRRGVFIAEHGSWNRTKKSGYRIAYVTIDGTKAGKPEVFAEGWLRPDETVWGRPADVLPMPDGSLLVSDDLAGAIYRIRYTAH
jgi:glucose/arabinose dehydrogenase